MPEAYHLEPPPSDNLVHRLRLAGAAVLLLTGVGWVAGPAEWRSSPTYYVVSGGPVGMRAWGVVFTVLGAVQLYYLIGRHWTAARRALIVGAGLTAGWAASFVLGAFVGKLAGVSGPLFWAFFSFAQATAARRIDRYR